MRAAAILGLGCSGKDLLPFQKDSGIEWRMGVPARADEVDVVLLFGGDGTIHRHLGALVNLGFPVLVVPAGSGNDFACSLGLRRVRDSLAAWEQFCRGAKNITRYRFGADYSVEQSEGGAIDCDLLLLRGGSGPRRGGSPACQQITPMAAGTRWVRPQHASYDFQF